MHRKNEVRKRMYLIVGLGNPTSKYAGTRHNIGFSVITQIADMNRIDMNIKDHKAICGKGYLGGEKVLLMEPQTYMNLSGEAVRAAMDFYKLSNEDLIVIYDDISLDVGQLRIRKKGSAGGHNGIKSIIAHLNTDEFMRIKVGVGNKPDGWDLADYVLGRFQDEELPMVRESVKLAADACETILTESIDVAMNQYNKKIKV